MKLDRENCYNFQDKEAILEDLNVSKTNKKKLKKLVK
jgi:hypothetical protein